MTSTSLALLLLTTLQSTPVDLTAVTLPPDTRIDVPLVPTGEAEARGEATLTRLRIRVNRTDVLGTFGPTFPALVVWAVSPEGEFRNLGELEIDGRRAELETTAPWQRLGILVTAEPHYLVDAPGASVALKSGDPSNDRVRADTISARVGRYDYSTLPAPPPGPPSRVSQARLAYQIADRSEAAELAPAELRAARVALDSMEELLGRDLSSEILLPYVNDAIRLSARATETARSRLAESELEEAERRASRLERELQEARQEAQAAAQRRQEAEARLAEILNDLERVREENRTRRLENDDLARRLRAAEAEVARLSDPWPPIRTALARLGARETARGMVVTIPDEHLRADRELETEAVLLLERLIGALAVGSLPDITIEGHARASRSEAESLAESTELAEAVERYLIESGIPQAGIRAEGIGSARPIAGAVDAGQDSLNRRVEIIVRQAAPR